MADDLYDRRIARLNSGRILREKLVVFRFAPLRRDVRRRTDDDALGPAIHALIARGNARRLRRARLRLRWSWHWRLRLRRGLSANERAGRDKTQDADRNEKTAR